VEQVGIFDAKVHLSKLVARASRGEVIVITNNGQPMAKLTPIEHVALVPVDEAIKQLREIRSRSKLGRELSVEDLIRDGRRF
jgi:prevent-host-death family protein